MATKQIRCAVYTRKSTEEGLEQAFNSLDAQREACEAYIASQTHEGWVLVPGEYNDGGFSGGNMDRPALKRLLGEIKAGKIDVIVVYKVDRLTRNLGDFAKIVDVLDATSASFVSVTQAFNTTTSMGRLTLNVLLSFAQFEREVTGERIRDKIAASKAKGMWMGGVVPLGYDVVERKLVINPADAEQVRHIFNRYLDLKSVLALKVELDEQGITSKVRTSRAGNVSGGASMSRGALYQLLQNQLYIGKVTHKGNVFDGEQNALVDAGLFNAAQQLLAENRVDATNRLNAAAEPSPLAGKLWDAEGRRMSPSHTTRRFKRYRYYVSRQDVPSAVAPWRIPAGDLEAVVVDKLCELLDNPERVHDIVDPFSPSGQQIEAALARAADFAAKLKSSAPGPAIDQLVERVDVAETAVAIRGKTMSLIPADLAACVPAITPIDLCVEINLARIGREMKLVVAAAATGRAPDPGLVKLVVKAFVARRAVERNPGSTIVQIAKAQGHAREYFGVLLRLSHLAPDIQGAILAGEQPIELTRQKLARCSALPFDWQAQRKILGLVDA